MAAIQHILLESLTLFISHRRWLMMLALTVILVQRPVLPAKAQPPALPPPVDALVLVDAAN